MENKHIFRRIPYVEQVVKSKSVRSVHLTHSLHVCANAFYTALASNCLSFTATLVPLASFTTEPICVCAVTNPPGPLSDSSPPLWATECQEMELACLRHEDNDRSGQEDGTRRLRTQ